MALIVCTNCGKKISDKAKECIHCQYPIQVALQEEAWNPFPFQIQTETPRTAMTSDGRDREELKAKDVNYLNKQTLTIISADIFLLFDPKVAIYINESFHSTQSIRDGFSVIVPIEREDIKLKLSASGLLGIQSTELNLHLDLAYSYRVDVTYCDDFVGKYSKKYSLKSLN